MINLKDIITEASKPKSTTAKDILAFMVANIKNISSSKVPKGYKEYYIKSMIDTAKQKPQLFARSFGPFKKSDWIGDITGNWKMNLSRDEGKLNEDRFGHKITALGNQIYIQLDKMEQMLSGKEKNNYMKARSKFWKITKTAMEDEEQK
jgi:hypothetical protein